MLFIKFCELDGSNSSQSDVEFKIKSTVCLDIVLAANDLPAANSDIHTLQKQLLVEMNETELTIGNIIYTSMIKFVLTTISYI